MFLPATNRHSERDMVKYFIYNYSIAHKIQWNNEPFIVSLDHQAHQAQLGRTTQAITPSS